VTARLADNNPARSSQMRAGYRYILLQLQFAADPIARAKVVSDPRLTGHSLELSGERLLATGRKPAR
jgi:hypothetical protein